MALYAKKAVGRTANEYFLDCQNLSRKNSGIIWTQLPPSPSRMKIDDDTRFPPIGLELDPCDTAMISATPVESVAKMFSFGIR